MFVFFVNKIMRSNLFIKKTLNFIFLHLTKYIDIDKLLPFYFIYKYPFNKTNFNKFKSENPNLVLIHYHVPRCAGTSVKNFFLNHFGFKSILSVKKLIKISKKKLSKGVEENIYKNFGKKYALIHSHRANEINYNKFNNKFEFTILRRPKELYYSRYNYLKNYRDKKIKNKRYNNIVIKYNLTFDEYLQKVEENNNDNVITRYFSNNFDFFSFEIEKQLSKKNKILGDDDFNIALSTLKNINVFIIKNNNNIINDLLEKIKLNSSNLKINYLDNTSLKKNKSELVFSENSKNLEKLTNYDNKLIEELNL